ncbi:decaprenylphospho-beta-D-ribofuranose 2-oxidase [Thermomonospora echinospora]|uniref:Decaprenylphospho-beta-D-ribofuranose 2-oxidase n=1 Tax=Thermomonospora echinospora TaxID=1992 RepID=A0A1H6DNZ7_9ACTN|nr:FAD-binding oxidoreductase [Thermomonospora echinospora]SEG86513.1 decaprenylphospho-beta-D-ribofuranose 2-oxidase [Thermomonospora echinospora]
MTESRMLTGWGRTAPSAARVITGADDEALIAAVLGAGPRGLLARGSGRAYGDVAQNAGGVIVDMTRRARIVSWDARQGVVTVESGVTLDRLLRTVVPAGWCLPVIPGTGHVTVGGAIAADVHGKNHGSQGGFGAHVLAFDLLTGNGSVRTATPGSEVFQATVGGMGLTGVVLRATLRLIPVTTAWVRVTRQRAGRLDSVLAGLMTADHAVAWLDLSRTGARTGRGVLTLGSPAEPDELPPGTDPLAYAAVRSSPALAVPVSPLFRPQVIGAANSVIYRRAPSVPRSVARPMADYFFPLDRVIAWNRAYGRGGFVQYQFVLPHDAAETLHRVITMLASADRGVSLAVLKRLGPGGSGLLSFPTAGWTLAADLPACTALADRLDRLDRLVAGAGGRVYLAKDARLRPDVLTAMYPKLARFRAVRRALDPAGIFTSDLARRLSL